jgi:hypothetical protein
MKKAIVWALILVLLLSGCSSHPGEATGPQETTQSISPTNGPEMEEPGISDLAPGYYLISSVGKNGDVQFYCSLDAENGWLLLREDGTGILSFEGTEGQLTWNERQLHWQDQTLMGMVMTYYDSELEKEESMLALYFMDPVVSVVFRPAPMPEENPVAD